MTFILFTSPKVSNQSWTRLKPGIWDSVWDSNWPLPCGMPVLKAVVVSAMPQCCPYLPNKSLKPWPL